MDSEPHGAPRDGLQHRYGWRVRHRNLGPYAGWSANNAERDRFTGEVRFSHVSTVVPDDLAPSFFIHLVFVEGVLREADYGTRPG